MKVEREPGREGSSDSAAFHFLDGFLRGHYTFLDGDGVFGAAVNGCVTNRMAALAPDRFR